MHGGDVRAGELDSRIGNYRQLAVRENPAGNVVWPPPLRQVLARELVVEDPFVSRRHHRQGTDPCDELTVVQRPVLLALAREQPLQRVVGVGDEAVEGSGRVVLRQAHDSTPLHGWSQRDSCLATWPSRARPNRSGGNEHLGDVEP